MKMMFSEELFLHNTEEGSICFIICMLLLPLDSDLFESVVSMLLI